MPDTSTAPPHQRTHEENQERSLIAASHRGDISMESRMESARKASEIHKSRTGKSLIINEDLVRDGIMYPEEGEIERETNEEEMLAEKAEHHKDHLTTFRRSEE